MNIFCSIFWLKVAAAAGYSNLEIVRSENAVVCGEDLFADRVVVDATYEQQAVQSKTFTNRG